MKALTINASEFYKRNLVDMQGQGNPSLSNQTQKATVTAQLSLAFHDEIESFNHLPDSI